jgi:hypothetical protein
MRQNTTNGTITPTQAQALTALLERATITEAARQAAVDRTTVHRWLKEDATFIAEHNAGRAELVRRARAELRSLTGAAVAVVRELLDPETPSVVATCSAGSLGNATGCAGAGPYEPNPKPRSDHVLPIPEPERTTDDRDARPPGSPAEVRAFDRDLPFLNPEKVEAIR